MLHDQNQIDLEALCAPNPVPEHIQRYFEKATKLLEKVRGSQFRLQAMVILYMQALRLDPATEKDAEKEPEVPEEPWVPTPSLPKLGKPVLVREGATDYRAVLVGAPKDQPDKVRVSYGGQDPVLVNRSAVRAEK